MKRFMSMLVASLLLLGTLCGAFAATVLPQDDFYTAVNQQWLADTKLPSDQPQISAFSQLADKVQPEIEDILKGKNVKPGSDVSKAVNYYNNLLNTKERNARGLKDVQVYLDKVNAIDTLDDLTALLCDPTYSLLSSLFSLEVTEDFADNRVVALYITPTTLQQADAAEYATPTPDGIVQKESLDKLNRGLFMAYGDTEQVGQAKVNKLFAFEKELAKSMFTLKDSYGPSYIKKIHNVSTFGELEKSTKNFPIAQIIRALGAEKAELVGVMQPKWLAALDAMYVPENLEALKIQYALCIMQSFCTNVTIELENLYFDCMGKITGVAEKPSAEKLAFDAVNRNFGNLLGKAYVEQNFSADTKKEIENMVKDSIKVFQKRLTKATWLSKATRKNAIEKLSAMKIKVGYPNKWTDYSQLQVRSFAQGGNLIDNIVDAALFVTKMQYEKLGKPSDPQQWITTPQMVNAFYNPTDNSINFPAAILQPPFYDPKASYEANLGGIGAIIAHEITHAFDPTGSQFDKNGNMKNWWTAADTKAFQARTQKVGEYYASMEIFPGEFINTQLTIGETVADLGGLACAIDLASARPHPDYKALFESWAKIWRQKTTDAYAKLLLKQDPHAPSKARVNGIVPHFDEFYKALDVKEGDAMYISPKDRLLVW